MVHFYQNSQPIFDWNDPLDYSVKLQQHITHNIELSQALLSKTIKQLNQQIFNQSRIKG